MSRQANQLQSKKLLLFTFCRLHGRPTASGLLDHDKPGNYGI